jgi:glycine dehydrogenase
MIEPTESYTRAELDRFAAAVKAIHRIIIEHPEALLSAPHFTPIDRVEEAEANRSVCLSEPLDVLPALNAPRLASRELAKMPVEAIYAKIIEAAAEVSLPETV